MWLKRKGLWQLCGAILKESEFSFIFNLVTLFNRATARGALIDVKPDPL